MKLVTISVTGFLLLSCVSGYMDTNNFVTNIKNQCYVNGDHLSDVQPRSLENFLHLLEKFETAKSDLQLFDMVNYLLSRFSIEGVIKLNDFQIESSYRNGQNIMHKIIEDTVPELEEDTFTEDEKCALHFMLSYTVNNTFREGKDNSEFKMPPRPMPTGSYGVLKRAPPTVALGRERGVVSLRSNPVHAFALGRVLAGIYLGLNPNVKSKKLTDILAKNLPQYINVDSDEEIIPLYAFTLADILTFLQINKKPLIKNLGPNGNWTTPCCPEEYQMNQNERYVSYSLLRGAVDGFLLGSRIKTVQEEHPDIKLSQILRMYYSYDGIRPSKLANELSYYKRRDLIENYIDELKQQVLNYAKLYGEDRILVDSEEYFVKFSEDTVNELKNSFDELFLLENGVGPDECGKDLSLEDENKCETPSDVIFVLDDRVDDDDNLKNQLHTIVNIVNDLDLTMNRSSVSVFTRNVNITAYALEAMVDNSTSTAKTMCILEHFEGSGSNNRRQNEQTVIKILNRTIRKIKDGYGITGGHPSQVVIYFNYENTVDANTELTNALKDFHFSHKDVLLYAVGENQDVLEMYVKDKQRDVITESNTEELINELKQKICEAPALLKYHECKNEKDMYNDQNTYKGSVIPNHVQYFYMYPENFYSSKDMKVVFETNKGDMKVCYNRRESNPEDESKNCLMTNEGDKKIEVPFKQPCSGLSKEKCSIIHFAVIGEENNADTETTCSDASCRRTDEVQFSVRYKGVRCNSAPSSYNSAIQVVLLCLGFYMLFIKKQL